MLFRSAAEPKGKKKAAKAEKSSKAEKKPASTELAIHINKTGRVCFGKAAAARIGDMAHMLITIEGKQVRMVAQAKATEATTDIRRAGKRPYVSATKLLKTTGFDGTRALDIVAAPFNSHGFEFKVA